MGGWLTRGAVVLSTLLAASTEVVAVLTAEVRGSARLLLLDVREGSQDILRRGAWGHIVGSFWISEGASLGLVGRVWGIVAAHIWLGGLHILLNLLQLQEQVALHVSTAALVNAGGVVGHQVRLRLLLGRTSIHVVVFLRVCVSLHVMLLLILIHLLYYTVCTLCILDLVFISFI